MKRVAYVGLAVLSLLAVPTSSEAQGCILGGGSVFSGYVGTVSTYALPDQNNSSCAGLRVESRAWVQLWDAPLLCTNGNQSGNKCERIVVTQSWGDEAVAAFNASFLCGRWTGKGQHVVRFEANWSQVVSDNETSGPLGGNRCLRGTPEECEEWELYVEGSGCVPYNSPILVPLTQAQNYRLTSVEAGVKFDWDGDGVAEQTAWTAADARLAFLAIDMDGDGKITSGKELVGDRLVPGAQNGWEALASMAPDDVSELYAGVDLFDRLLLWEDRNHDGVSQSGELQPARNVISELGLGYVKHDRRDGHGNLFMFEGRALVRTGPGRNPASGNDNMRERIIKLYDVFFRTGQ